LRETRWRLATKRYKAAAARIRESTDKAVIEDAQRSIDRETAAIEKLERQAKRLKTLYMETEDPSIPADLKRTNVELADARNRQRAAQVKLTQSINENDIEIISDRIAAVFADFKNKTKIEQKKMLHQYVEQINVCTYRGSNGALLPLPVELAANGHQLTPLGKLQVSEWAHALRDNAVLGTSLDHYFNLEFIMKPGQPDPYILESNNLQGITSKTLSHGS
jgi:hypothetical protein